MICFKNIIVFAGHGHIKNYLSVMDKIEDMELIISASTMPVNGLPNKCLEMEYSLEKFINFDI